MIENGNTFTMEEFAESVDAFLSLRRYETLQNKGSVSARSARLKAGSEYEIFIRTQKVDSDFDRKVRKMLEGMNKNE